MMKVATAVYLFSLTAYGARTVRCDDSKSIDVFMRPAYATILNFPIKPEQVVIGGKSQVSVEYIKNDLAITPLTSDSKTNIFVYLFGRRCGFNLRISTQSFDSLVMVKDPDESKMKVRIE